MNIDTKLINKMLNNKEIQKMKQHKHHGQISTFDHTLDVLWVSLVIASILKLDHTTMTNIIIGSILHDFYLYDWHTGTHRFRKDGIHGWSHPKTSLRNAKEYFNINKKQENIIRSHMFPLTLFHMPICKEAWIVTLSDKYCAIYEYLTNHTIKLKGSLINE